MKFEQLYSSSSGNLYQVTAGNGKRLLIECGVPWAKLQKALHYDLSGIVGCLVTHEHKDHSKAVFDVALAGIDVYMTAGTKRALKAENQRRMITLGISNTWYLPVIGDPTFQFMACQSHHDAEDPSLFVVRCDDEYLLFATDTSHITQRFKIPFGIIAIECSYDKDMLQERVDTGAMNEALAKRLLSSHMEKRNTMQYLAEFCDLSKCQQLHLLHLSGDNLDKEQTRREFEQRFFMEVKTV